MIARLALAGSLLAATLSAAAATEMRGTTAPETAPEAAEAAPVEPVKARKRSEARRSAPAKPAAPEPTAEASAAPEGEAKPEEPAVRQRAPKRAAKNKVGKLEAQTAAQAEPAPQARTASQTAESAGATAAGSSAAAEPAASAEASAETEPKGRRAKRARAKLAKAEAAGAGEAPAEETPANAAATGSGRDALDALIAAHAKANGLRESFVHRVVRIESRHNPKAIGRGGVYGLMQIKVPTARALGYSGGPAGLLDADTNLTYAVRYLAGAYKVAGGDEIRAYSYYQRGYYYAAKARGLHKELPRPVEPKAVAVASAEAAPEPAAVGRPNAPIHDPGN